MACMFTEFQDQLVRHITSAGNLGDAQRHLLQTEKAKFVRPAFVFACGEALGLASDQLTNEANAVELMHTATLLHDDIIDEATERRGKESVNAKHGNKIAVLAGDGLLAKSLSLLLHTPQADKAVGRAGETLVGMTEAVAIEIEAYKTPGEITKEELINVVDGKTGALFALCGYLAGLAAGNEKAATQFSRIGILMGQVFQINDDIDDIEEDTRGNVTTIPTLLGEEAARVHIEAAIAEIKATIVSLDCDAQAQQKLLVTIGEIIRRPL